MGQRLEDSALQILKGGLEHCKLEGLEQLMVVDLELESEMECLVVGLGLRLLSLEVG